MIHNGKVGFTAWADGLTVRLSVRNGPHCTFARIDVYREQHNILPTTNVVLGNELSQTIKNLDKWDPEVAKLSSEWALQTALGLERDILKHDGIAMSNHIWCVPVLRDLRFGKHQRIQRSYSGTSGNPAGGALVEDADNKKGQACGGAPIGSKTNLRISTMLRNKRH